MLRSIATLTAVAPLFAQQTIDPGRVFPVTAPIRSAGTFNLASQRWLSPSSSSQLQASVTVIYDNTCTWSGGAYYTGVGSCETYIDEGEIPGPGNPSAPFGATASNLVVLTQISYCTNFAAPRIRLGFYDHLGGLCPTNTAPGALAAQASPAPVGPANPQGTAYYDLGVIGLPGDATPGGSGVACWMFGLFLGNNGFCLQSEGDGVWDNDLDQDRFRWSFEMDDTQVAGSAASGIVISGDPAQCAMGACTYNQPCPATGATGLNTSDDFWINVDGDSTAPGNTGATCVSAPTAGTACYLFGGYPGNPFASFWLTMVARGECGGCAGSVLAYCDQTAPTVTQGCTSAISAVGLPSASNPAPFTVSITGLNQGVSAVLCYGISNATYMTWSPESKLCVQPPTQRLGLFDTGGSGACTGSHALDMNAVMQSPGYLGTPAIAGQRFNMQVWQRDPASSKTTNYSQALEFVTCP